MSRLHEKYGCTYTVQNDVCHVQLSSGQHTVSHSQVSDGQVWWIQRWHVDIKDPAKSEKSEFCTRCSHQYTTLILHGIDGRLWHEGTLASARPWKPNCSFGHPNASCILKQSCPHFPKPRSYSARSSICFGKSWELRRRELLGTPELRS